jgi:hypothetical protein
MILSIQVSIHSGAELVDKDEIMRGYLEGDPQCVKAVENNEILIRQTRKGRVKINIRTADREMIFTGFSPSPSICIDDYESCHDLMRAVKEWGVKVHEFKIAD